MADAAHHNTTSVIRFYGSYTQVETFNIVLEYADKGSLETFLKFNDPPTQMEHIRDFWKNLLELLKALMYLHNHSEGGMYVVLVSICTSLNRLTKFLVVTMISPHETFSSSLETHLACVLIRSNSPILISADQ